MGEGIKHYIRLHLGCGKKHWPGFVNIDFQNSDIDCDIRKLPFCDEMADEAHAIHVIEHIQRFEVLETLKEWRRVLKESGMLVLELPCLDKIIPFLARRETNPRMTLWALYGDPNYKNEHMMHKWCYTKEEMINLMIEAGFCDVREEKPCFHIGKRDMRIVGFK